MTIPEGTWIVPTGACPDPWLRLLCFPFAGAGSLLFATWPRYFAPFGIDVCAVDLPGREARANEPPETDMQRLADRVVAGVASHLDLPFALFGHSMGALLAYEIARRQRAQSPVCIITSACRAPHHPDPEPFVHTLPREGMIAELTRYGGSQSDLLSDPELLDMTLPRIRADAELTEAYRLVEDAPLACPILAIAASDDHLVERAHVAAWEPYTTGGFTLRIVEGDHFVVRTRRQDVMNVVAEALLPLRGRLS